MSLFIWNWCSIHSNHMVNIWFRIALIRMWIFFLFMPLLGASIEKSCVLTCSRKAILYNFSFFCRILIVIIILHDWNNLFVFFLVSLSPPFPLMCCSRDCLLCCFVWGGKKAKLQVWHTNYRWVLSHTRELNMDWADDPHHTFIVFGITHTMLNKYQTAEYKLFSSWTQTFSFVEAVMIWLIIFFLLPRTEWSEKANKILSY